MAKLTDLRPTWINVPNWRSERPFHIGLSFICPNCRTHRVAVLFDPAIDPTNVAPDTTWVSTAAHNPGQNVWARTGDTFADITLTPSIDIAGHWHGHITNGEVQ